MIQILFYFGTEIILVTIRGNHITFANSSFGGIESTIEGLKLSKEGAIKEFPELKDNPNWKEEAIKKFKEKISLMENEDKIADYIIEDLRQHGYIPKYKQKKGFRREVIK